MSAQVGTCAVINVYSSTKYVRTRRRTTSRPTIRQVWTPCLKHLTAPTTRPGYKPTAVKSLDEYNKLDANDESLARWKASLGLGDGSNVDTNKPKVRGPVSGWCAL